MQVIISITRARVVEPFCITIVPEMVIYLCYHHVAVKCTPSVGASWALHVWANLSNYGRSESHVGHEMAIHNIDLPSNVNCDCYAHARKGIIHEASLPLGPLHPNILSPGQRSRRIGLRAQ